MSAEIMKIERRHVGPRMSQVVIHGDTIYLAGQVAADPSADVVGQTQQILRRIDELLQEVGADKSQILSATVWLADIADYGAMNTVWDAWVAPANTPARACVEGRLAAPHYRVEIAAIAGLAGRP
jgi:enamine deaminase RidA (YjgF/YER057c/UK114 family)